MKFSTKLALGSVGLLAAALCAIGLAMTARSFRDGLASARATLQTQQRKEAYAIERNIYGQAAATAEGYEFPLYILAAGAQTFAEQTGDGGAALAVYLDGQHNLYSNLPQTIPHTVCLAALADGGSAWRIQRAGTRYYLLLVRPLQIPGRQVDLLCAYDITAQFDARDTQLQWWLAATLVILLAGGALAVAFSRVLTRPLTTLQAASSRIAAGDYASRTCIDTGDEIGSLSRSFDAMAAAVETRAAEQAQTVQRQQDFIAAFSHEIKTPMTAMLGYADLLRARPQEESLQREAAGYIYHETHRLEDLSRHLLALMELEEPGVLERVRVSDTALFAQTIRSLPSDAEITSLPGGAVVAVDRALWVDLLRNLLLNALQACEGKPGASVTLRCRKLGAQAVFTVADTGCGIPAEDLPRLTEPFYMVDKSRSRAAGGSGIGLALCRRIAALHGTKLQFASEVGAGTTVTVTLPLAEVGEGEEP